MIFLLLITRIVSQSASNQKDLLWTQITNNRRIYHDYEHENFKNIFKFFTSFQCNQTNQNIENIGAQAQVQYIPSTNQQYSGLFEGASNVILRLSSLSYPDTSMGESYHAKNNLIPKLQMKFFRSQLPAVDITAMYSYLGIDTWNIFQHNLSTSLNEECNFQQLFFNEKRSQCNPYIFNFGIKQLSTHDQWGKQSQYSSYPYKLIFQANSQVKHLFRDVFEDLFTSQLKKIPIGTNIYDVYAVRSPEDGCITKIGTIKLKSKFVTSKFADQEITFSDQSVKEDLQDHPEWDKYMTQWKFMGLLNINKIEEGLCQNKNQIEIYDL